MNKLVRVTYVVGPAAVLLVSGVVLTEFVILVLVTDVDEVGVTVDVVPPISPPPA
jgi:hypothetical protein